MNDFVMNTICVIQDTLQYMNDFQYVYTWLMYVKDYCNMNVNVLLLILRQFRQSFV